MSSPDPHHPHQRVDTHDCPERPSSLHRSELGFVRKPMVSWLNPRQLVDTAARVVLSGIFGAYADKREMQALAVGELYDQSDGAELWLDYVADLGDGWAPTYTVATLLATEKMELRSEEEETHVTNRGRILVMGGDQVYPVPKGSEYDNRFLGPYRAALPCAPGGQALLFAVPGTHDWYDGLVNFDSVFCRENWIGGWKTSQSRSYFALKLPNRWWLWGVDIQFGTDVDKAQLRYFSEEVAPHVEQGIESSCARPTPPRPRRANTRTRGETSTTSNVRSSDRPVARSCCTSRVACTTTAVTRRRTDPAYSSPPVAAELFSIPPISFPKVWRWGRVSGGAAIGE